MSNRDLQEEQRLDRRSGRLRIRKFWYIETSDTNYFFLTIPVIILNLVLDPMVCDDKQMAFIF